MTAAALLERLKAAGVTVTMECDKLRVSANVPEALRGPLAILQTGIRALLTGHPWYGYTGGVASWHDGGKNPLDPHKPIPAGLTVLCVSGGRWNRITPDQVNANPGLWDRAAVTRTARPESKPATSLLGSAA